MSARRCSSVVLMFLMACEAFAQTAGDPTPLDPEIQIAHVAGVQPDAVKVDYRVEDGRLYYLTRGGQVWQVTIAGGANTRRLVGDVSALGIGEARGLAVAVDGTFFVLGHQTTDDGTTGPWVTAKLVRGELGRVAISWETVMETEPFQRSATNYDHFMNGLAIDPRGEYVYISSGSRTDHGEILDGGGFHPGVREVPLTAAIFRLPADTTDAILPNDQTYLVDNAILFADGFRNTFDLAWGPSGHLFGPENGGDRDDSEEVNWIRQNGHYGFPWRIGTNDTGQQFPDYDPSQDLLISPAAGAEFSNDPTYPPPPEGVPFIDPIPNAGPDADRFVDPATGDVVDASESGLAVGSLTAHRSPLGLVFDTAGVLLEPYRRGGFVLSWTGGDSSLLGPMGDAGEDLLHLKLEFLGEDIGYRMSARRIVEGFSLPMDAVLVGSSLFVIEMSFGGPSPSIWRVDLPANVVSNEPPAEIPVNAIRVDSYPNPFANEITVTVRSEKPVRAKVEIVDVVGRTVVGTMASGAPTLRHEWSLQVPNLSPGVYFLRIQTPDGVLSRAVTLVK